MVCSVKLYFPSQMSRRAVGRNLLREDGNEDWIGLVVEAGWGGVGVVSSAAPQGGRRGEEAAVFVQFWCWAGANKGYWAYVGKGVAKSLLNTCSNVNRSRVGITEHGGAAIDFFAALGAPVAGVFLQSLWPKDGGLNLFNSIKKAASGHVCNWRWTSAAVLTMACHHLGLGAQCRWRRCRVAQALVAAGMNVAKD